MSEILASLLGYYCLIMGLVLVKRPERFARWMASLDMESPLWIVLGIIPLMIGLILVHLHNVWIFAWPVLITLMAWLALLKGIAILSCPQYAQRMLDWFSNHVKLRYYGIGLAIFGALLIVLSYS